MNARWYFAIYKARCCWIGLANPRPNGRLLAPGGRFAFGQSRAETLANLRAEVAR